MQESGVRSQNGCGAGASQDFAEGFKRAGRADKVRMLNIAQGPLEECRYDLILAADLKCGSNTTLVPQAEEVSKILDAYSKAILTPDS
ncbi:MAG: four helix bundle protein [Bryobacterales bacterium]|nr:four helix bundle protein [Bryobacterales bacterium]